MFMSVQPSAYSSTYLSICLGNSKPSFQSVVVPMLDHVFCGSIYVSLMHTYPHTSPCSTHKHHVLLYVTLLYVGRIGWYTNCFCVSGLRGADIRSRLQLLRCMYGPDRGHPGL